MALLVESGGRWLADVGFGDSFLEPLEMDATGEQHDGVTGYRIEHMGHTARGLRRAADGGWEGMYNFTLEPRPLAAFGGMCRRHQESPSSHFRRHRICSLATPEGRVTLSDRTLVVTTRGERREAVVATDEDAARILAGVFGIRDRAAAQGWISTQQGNESRR
jgi:N-hydroxyarylamine O-acetyltransferase